MRGEIAGTNNGESLVAQGREIKHSQKEYQRRGGQRIRKRPGDKELWRD